MKKKIVTYLHLLVLFALSFCGLQSLHSQEIKASAAIDSTILPIGQQSMFRLELIQPTDLVLKLPLFIDTLIDKVEILDQTEWDSSKIDETQILLKKDLLLTSFDSGFYYIPPVKYEIENGGGFVETNPVILKVITFEVDTTQGVFDIITVQDVPYTFSEMVPWLIGAFLALVVVFLFIFLFKKIKGKEPIFVKKEKPKDPPHVTALKELDDLKASKLWQTDRVKEFHTKLTDILRVYIEGRYNVPALEQISDEILSSLKMVDQDMGAALPNLEQILKTADLVKFAKHKPLADENDLSLMDAYLFVNQTKIVEVKSLDEARQELDSESEDSSAIDNDLDVETEDERSGAEETVGAKPKKKKGESDLAEQLRRMSEGNTDMNEKKEDA